MLKVGDRVIVKLPNDEEIESRVKAISGDHVEIEWPQAVDQGGWVTDRGMMTQNADGSWNAMVSERGDGIHPRPR